MPSRGGNFDLIATKTYVCLANGPRTGEFQYGSYRSYSLYNISNTNFYGSTYFYVLIFTRYASKLASVQFMC